MRPVNQKASLESYVELFNKNVEALLSSSAVIACQGRSLRLAQVELWKEHDMLTGQD